MTENTPYNSSYYGPQMDNAVAAGLAVRGVNGLVKSDGSGNISRAVPGTDYPEPVLFNDYDLTLWKIGTLTSANGTNYTSTNRIRTEMLSLGVKAVTPKSGYKIAVYVYNASGTYQGVWNGTEAVPSVMTWFTETVDFADLPTGSQVRIIAGDTSDSTITDSNQDTVAQNIILTRLTDDSLSHSGYPADASTTGYAFYRAKNRRLHTPAALTYWHIADAYSSGVTPSNIPANSYTEAYGSVFSFSGITLNSSYLYLVICLANLSNTAIRYYIVLSRSIKQIFVGRTASSGSSVSWTDWTMPGVDTEPTEDSDNLITSGAVYDAIQGAIGGSY